MQSDIDGLLESLAKRFAGLDLQYRRDIHGSWIAPWRARMVTSKNERAEYRLVAWGKTSGEALNSLAGMVEQEDSYEPTGGRTSCWACNGSGCDRCIPSEFGPEVADAG